MAGFDLGEALRREIEGQGALPAAAQPEVLVQTAVRPQAAPQSDDEQMDAAIQKLGGEFEIQLKGGGLLRVTESPRPSLDAVEVDHATFKAIGRVALQMNGRVLRVMTREQAEKYYKDEANGHWVTPQLFVEFGRDLDEAKPTGAAMEVLGAPTDPPGPPQVDPRWASLGAAQITRSRPVKVDGRVIGALNETPSGNAYMGSADVVRLPEQKPDQPWTAGSFVVFDESVFKDYIVGPQAVVVLRTHIPGTFSGKHILLTHAGHMQAYAGAVRIFGRRKIVVPATEAHFVIQREAA